VVRKYHSDAYKLNDVWVSHPFEHVHLALQVKQTIGIFLNDPAHVRGGTPPLQAKKNRNDHTLLSCAIEDRTS